MNEFRTLAYRRGQNGEQVTAHANIRENELGAGETAFHR